MLKQRKHRAPLIAIIGLLGVFAVPAAAQANHVNAAESSASCTTTGEGTLVVKFEAFVAEEMHVSGTISLDGAVIKTYTPGATTEAPVAWTGPNGTLTYTTGVLSGGTHTIAGDFTWPDKGDNPGTVSKTFTCPTPPPPPPPPPPPAGGGVLPETIVSGIARLRGPSGCVKTAFRARVTGRSIASVAFRVDGKLVKRITGERSRYTVRIKPRGYGFGRHRVVARVTFVTGSGTAPRRLPLTFRRCAQGAVAPRFTG
jgi:hypothetical protein